MDIELYVSDKVDSLGLSLNFRQRNFLEGLLVDAYSKGNTLAHSVMGKGAFDSAALPILKEAIEPLLEQRESLEKLSTGDWVGLINTKNLIHNIRDRLFARNASYTHREDLQLHDLVDYENQIAGEVVGLTEEGLTNALEEWCQNKMMGLAGDELERSTTPPLKTKVPKPLVNHNKEAEGIDASIIEAGDVIDFKSAKDKIKKKEGGNADLEQLIKKWLRYFCCYARRLRAKPTPKSPAANSAMIEGSATLMGGSGTAGAEISQEPSTVGPNLSCPFPHKNCTMPEVAVSLRLSCPKVSIISRLVAVAPDRLLTSYDDEL